MKIPALLTVLALSCGAAFAQSEPVTSPVATTTDQSIARGNRVDGTAAKTRSDGKMMGSSAATAKDTTMAPSTTTASTGDTLTDKTKRGAHKVADATRHTAHKAKHSVKKSARKAKNVAQNDTRSMGASSTDMNSGTRQARMDAAYNDFKSKQK